MSHVSLETVIKVLSITLGSNVSFSRDSNDLTIVKNGIPEVYRMPSKVHRGLLQRLSKRYDIKIEYFYHSAMIQNNSESKQ